MNNDLGNTIENNIEELPQEVSDFIFEEGLEKVVSEIGTLLNNSEQTEHIYNDVTFYLLGTSTLEEVVGYIDGLPISIETKNKIKTIIQEKVIDELQLLIEVSSEMDSLAPSIVPAKSVSSDSIARMSQTFTTPITLTPTKRVYTETPAVQPPLRQGSAGQAKPLAEAIPASDASKKVDPYLEPIDGSK